MDLEVRFVHRTLSGGWLCGARVRSRDDAESEAWRALALRHVHPGTSVGSTFNDDAWSLYERSGYFNLSGMTADGFGDLKSATFTVNERLDAAPEVGFRVVHARERGVAASVSMARPYAASWLGHQMAKEKGALDRGDVLRSLYERAYEPLVPGDTFRWMLGYCERTVRWMKAAHFDFAESLAPSGEACLVHFRLLRVPCDLAPPPAARGAKIDHATSWEVERLLGLVAANRPRAYAQALDLVPERVSLAETRARWTSAGLERTRDVLVERTGGVATGAAVVETAERGTNLFHLLDSVRLFTLVPCGPEARARLYARLLYACAEQMRARGRTSFVYFCECATELPPGLIDLGEGYTWIVSASHATAFLEHVRRLTGVRR